MEVEEKPKKLGTAKRKRMKAVQAKIREQVISGPGNFIVFVEPLVPTQNIYLNNTPPFQWKAHYQKKKIKKKWMFNFWIVFTKLSFICKTVVGENFSPSPIFMQIFTMFSN